MGDANQEFQEVHEGRPWPADTLPPDGRVRVHITAVEPAVDGGRHPAKAVVGDPITVAAQLVADGHDRVAGLVEWEDPDGTRIAVPLRPQPDDWWAAVHHPARLGYHRFRVHGWVDPFQTWLAAFLARAAAGVATAVDVAVGAAWVREAARGAPPPQRARLERQLARLTPEDLDAARAAAEDPELADLMAAHGPRPHPAVSGWFPVLVEVPRARFSAWYECFPRSTSPDPGRPGTFRDLIALLPYIAGMGFDVLYVPPIHPIGRTGRKGPDNSLAAGPDDPGSPWAVGSAAGGHRAVHPGLGTLEDFRELAQAADAAGLAIALDLAFQCSPDHPHLVEHPEWFRWRPDGRVQYAENPPKRYEDIVPYDFETDAWAALWRELADTALFWAEQGVRVFRVDNPHTKPLAFWRWLIATVKRRYPDVVFLAEAFTRPALMYELAKAGFSQSYTYFTWRNTGPELRTYLEEIRHPRISRFFRPNFWPNTPDILPPILQHGGRPAFQARLILAATLSGNYGIYGPAFELMERQPLRADGEEYAHSEKYEIRHWDWARPDSLAPFIARVNQIRRTHPALQGRGDLVFHPCDNEQILVYSRRSEAGDDMLLFAVNLDPYHVQAGFVHVDVVRLGLAEDQTYTVHDLLTDERYVWRGAHNYVELRPERVAAHALHVEVGPAATWERFG
jgi:starch synthase (maltosyl-transferring)